MNKELDNFKNKLQTELDNYNQVHKEYQKMVTLREEFDIQLRENEAVYIEFGLLKSENQVYKLVGPVLIKVDQEEAIQNVKKRIEYITGKIKFLETTITMLKKKHDEHQDKLQKLHEQFQKYQEKHAVAFHP